MLLKATRRRRRILQSRILFYLAAASIINIILDLWFVIGMGWGVNKIV